MRPMLLIVVVLLVVEGSVFDVIIDDLTTKYDFRRLRREFF